MVAALVAAGALAAAGVAAGVAGVELEPLSELAAAGAGEEDGLLSFLSPRLSFL